MPINASLGALTYFKNAGTLVKKSFVDSYTGVFDTTDNLIPKLQLDSQNNAYIGQQVLTKFNYLGNIVFERQLRINGTLQYILKSKIENTEFSTYLYVLTSTNTFGSGTTFCLAKIQVDGNSPSVIWAKSISGLGVIRDFDVSGVDEFSGSVNLVSEITLTNPTYVCLAGFSKVDGSSGSNAIRISHWFVTNSTKVQSVGTDVYVVSHRGETVYQNQPRLWRFIGGGTYDSGRQLDTEYGRIYDMTTDGTNLYFLATGYGQTFREQNLIKYTWNGTNWGKFNSQNVFRSSSIEYDAATNRLILGYNSNNNTGSYVSLMDTSGNQIYSRNLANVNIRGALYQNNVLYMLNNNPSTNGYWLSSLRGDGAGVGTYSAGPDSYVYSDPNITWTDRTLSQLTVNNTIGTQSMTVANANLTLETVSYTFSQYNLF